ncbi:MAG TPA: penicillin acylase family protein [Baekduia sp.]|uniref:penicillin acylase family protein n=1 Tax=Baekduia sp. TaxID=2600305 RepID=UPI002CE424DF|nr:penicillin acylase family protein [Baekduia sp.]HMJ34963.1 penicillin acylase family protein [Baekduia sp.]
MLARRAILAAAVTLAAAAPTASADTTLNIIPHGNEGPGVPWATTPGFLPADTQAKMYDRITPLFRNITDDVLKPSADGTGYYKSAALLAEDDPSFVTSQTVSGTSPTAGPVSARIKRDPYGVPHIYADTDAGAIFGAGYVVAIDQALLLNQARYNGVAGLIDLPGVPAINLVLGLYNYKPSAKVVTQATELQNKSIEAQGTQGRQLLNDMDTYLAGINARMAETQPTAPKFTRTDLYAANAIKSQFLGQGGGQEIDNANFLASLRGKLGKKTGDAAFEDLRARNDPEATVTTSKSYPNQTSVSVSNPAGVVRLKKGSFKNSFVALPGAKAATATAASTGKRQLASNIMVVSGQHSATGKPLFVGGPQIGFNYPGLTLEMQIKSPSIDVRGATSAPFPGYMLIGRGADYAWSLTSAGADIIDTYAEKLCGGSKIKYSYKGKCLKMEKVDAGTIEKGGKTTKAVFYRTVHGPVVGYAKDDKTGKQIALSSKRSSYGRDAVDLLFNQQMTFGRVHSAKDFVNAAKKTPQTFNSFYGSATESAFYTSGAIPVRAKGVNGDLPVDGSGKYEWKGELAASKHPQVINPSTGYIVNWNNKPAANFPAGDDRFGNEGGIQRVDLLRGELARTPKATLANVLGAANAAATEDVRIVELWPTLKAMLAKGKAPSAQATQVADVLQQWHDAGGSRVDANLDGNIDNPGAVVLDAAWKKITDAGLCDRLGSGLCQQLEGRISRFDAPPGGQYSGWHQYMGKDLRTELGQTVKGKYHLTYCGNGSVSRCSKELWAALASAGTSIAAKQGADPSKWTEKAATITFTPLPLTTMQYTNKPTGIHQVMAFGQ